MKLTKTQLKNLIHGELDEGVGDWIKKWSPLSGKAKRVDTDHGGTSYEMPGDDEKKPEDPGAEEPEDPGAEEPEGKANKDIPLSIFKKQKDQPALRSDSGVVEVPLNAYIQKHLKLSAKSAQKIAKAIGANLNKAKGIPVAEDLIREVIDEMATLIMEIEEDPEKEAQRSIRDIKNSIRQQLSKGLKDGAPEKLVNDSSKIALAVHDLAKRGNVEEFFDWLKANTRTGKDIAAGHKSKPSAAAFQDLMQWALDDEVIRSYTGKHAERRGAEKADKSKERKELEKSLKGQGLVSQVVQKYAFRNKKADPEFAQALEKDPKIIKNINKMLRRQMRRRGYDDAEISKALSELLKRGN
tara:strand:- start:162 stop:1223 length:1062 start_codon:yes stop_codon:yes gene_type:complete